jgi:hypothetical protein
MTQRGLYLRLGTLYYLVVVVSPKPSSRLPFRLPGHRPAHPLFWLGRYFIPGVSRLLDGCTEHVHWFMQDSATQAGNFFFSQTGFCVSIFS